MHTSTPAELSRMYPGIAAEQAKKPEPIASDQRSTVNPGPYDLPTAGPAGPSNTTAGGPSASKTSGAAAPTAPTATSSAPTAAPYSGPSFYNPDEDPSLYVGDLDPSVTETDLNQIFMLHGVVASTRICRDAITGTSRGYGYVNYTRRSEADKAYNELNYVNLKGKPMRIMRVDRDGKFRKLAEANIFIKGITEKSQNPRALYETFKMFGEVVSLRVVEDENKPGTTRGYAFVQYKHASAAKKAIEQMNGNSIKGDELTVEIYKEHASRGNTYTNVYVRNIPGNITSKEFEDFMGQFGKVNSVYGPTVPDIEGVETAFACVNFETNEDAVVAVEKGHGMEYKDTGIELQMKRAISAKQRAIEASRARAERHKKLQGCNIYVKNIHVDVTDEELRSAFEKIGPVISASIMRHADGTSRGFGFVCMQTKELAAKVVTELGSTVLRNKPIYVNHFEKKKDRVRRLRELHAMQKLDNTRPAATGANNVPFRGRGRGRNNTAGGPTAARTPFGSVNINQMTAQMMQYQQLINSARAQGYLPMNRGVPVNNYRGRGNNRGYRGGPPRHAGPPRHMPAAPPRSSIMRPMAPRPPVPMSAPMPVAPADPVNHKQLLGESLYPLIQQREPKLAGKITGMLLELDNTEIMHIIEDQAALGEKINEALDVLRKHTLGGPTPGGRMGFE